MEKHLSCNARIKQASKDITFIIRSTYHIYTIFLHKLIQIAQQMIFINIQVSKLKLWILFLKILLDTRQFNFIPCTLFFVRIHMDKGNLKLIVFKSSYQ